MLVYESVVVMNVISTDVLVIGSGAAGLSAAVYAANVGRQVLILDKGALGRSGSSVGAVQIAGLGDFSHPEDEPNIYLNDILDSGRGLSDPSLAKILSNEIDKRLGEIMDWGLKLDQSKDQNVLLSHTSGHRLPRSLSAKKGKTGLGILHTLRKKATKNNRITTWSDVITVELVKDGNRVIGAAVIDLTTNTPYVIQSKSTILATGGAAQLFPVTSNPVQSTGDGFALGLQAGATLIDMEQIQFYPVSVAKPASIAGLCISFYHYSKLYNANGDRFMTKYAPDTLEDATRDVLSIAIATELKEGRGPLTLDATDVIDQVKQEFPHEYQLCADQGVDLAKEPITIAPASHFMMGGVLINEYAQSDVKGLYVAGETSGGLHGGNRLGNNALSECLVFGARAGIHASYETFTKTPKYDLAKLDKFLQTKSGQHRPFEIKMLIQEVMNQFVGIIRTESGLQEALNRMNAIGQKLQNIHLSDTSTYSREVLDFIEATHMYKTADAVVHSAFQRRESRGAHYIEEYPKLQNAIMHNLFYRRQGQNELRQKEVHPNDTTSEN
ncbi:L-aspartate oxidase [Aquisalibacillus elongatus]|uniref:Fumarate reductase (CoM/CoB) subunit A n=1 Tax=Aquisalibacillus elongatus TaxID=485577 RepID=A0A3N5B880_9BACI|nr:FAD-dependent oxidoreductase [Aquisalibacillus elongatus]RPF53946.1 fumarate reductase (CoM/CoB) subunit A [Aquisalibacillus elongatus]